MPTNSLSLSVKGLSHAYAGQPAIEGVSFEVPAGEIAALLGPSGCGKSTVLRAIAGLLPVAPGIISLGGKDVSPLTGRERGIGMVFQNYALFPHMTVAENVAYPLSFRGWDRKRRQARVEELLATVQLTGLARRLPKQLSGGQQQRVAVARALAVDPTLLLLDEPFAALDRALRLDLQIELVRLQRTLGITTIIVTHDQEEAQALASQLVVMNRGHVEQTGSPTEIYDRPATLFVNGFVGYAGQIRATVEFGLGGPIDGADLHRRNASLAARTRVSARLADRDHRAARAARDCRRRRGRDARRQAPCQRPARAERHSQLRTQ